VRNPARERSRNLNREVWESPSVYGGEDVKPNPLSIGNISDRQEAKGKGQRGE